MGPFIAATLVAAVLAIALHCQELKTLELERKLRFYQEDNALLQRAVEALEAEKTSAIRQLVERDRSVRS
jgi:hypothetical protein